ncbi:MAG: hydroxymethylbilane synthase [Saccharolobus sp.]|uniref:hydroxymethylbilane synthase n=1 Tax=Saccharolobus TaxID=2100760 RepID=UPI001F1160FA|nr:hydroxymethylbilane synthase [Saccharolobus shibatae]MCH4814373.1 hydroxymethylbilane synthase [Saccharolobus shibatae]
MKIRIAARGSKLSRIQVDMLGEKLKKIGIEYEIIDIKTKADLFSNDPLSKLGKGVFEKEVNEAVLEGKADIAVHSMKDILSEINPYLEIFAVLERDPPYDVLVAEKNLDKLDSNITIGTSSIRRKNFLKYIKPEINTKDIRGNVDTRIRKYLSKEYQGLILAEASLKRLNMSINYHRLNVYDFTPEANQGIIVALGRKKNEKIKEIFKEINHKDTLDEALAERAVISLVGGGCHSPIGVLFKKEGKEFYGIASYSDGKKKITLSISKPGDPYTIGSELGLLLKKEMKNEDIIP